MYSIPRSGPVAHLSRWRRLQWISLASLETAATGEIKRSTRTDSDRMPLSAGLLEMEPYRTPVVQLYQSQLGGQAAENLGDDARVYTRDNHSNWTERPSFSPERVLQKGAEGNNREHGAPSSPPARDMSRLELHDQSTPWESSLGKGQDRGRIS